MLSIIKRNATIAQLCLNRWVQLSVLDPDSQKIYLLKDGEFVAHEVVTTKFPTAARSIDWYRGWRDHLGFAEITGQTMPNTPTPALANVTGSAQ